MIAWSGVGCARALTPCASVRGFGDPTNGDHRTSRCRGLPRMAGTPEVKSNVYIVQQVTIPDNMLMLADEVIE
jgi:hypothetical protein